ncbi:MAG: response regulator transcription factor [Trueperaceae bacterium]|nr:response regulator transcription factor [Trueperaceae bacterium]
MSSGRILIVEDEERLAEALARELGRAYETAVAHTGGDALFLAETQRFDLVLLDLNLPDMDGIDVAAQLEGNPADVIMLTARSDVGSRVRGLYAGAADYVSKPFDMEELLARVYARMRARSRGGQMRWGPLELSFADRSCFVDGAPVELSAQEYHLLALLLEYPDRVFSKHTLEDRLYADQQPESNAIEVLVSRVRKKLTKAGLDRVIETIRGLGYVVRGEGP